MIQIKSFFNNLLSLSIAIIVILSSCGGGREVKVIVDNPTREEIKVSFENDFFMYLNPFEQKAMFFPVGTHKVFLKVNREETEMSCTFESDNEYVLNPTQSDYFIEEVGFGATGTFGMRALEKIGPKDGKEDPDKIQLQNVMVDSFSYSGFVTKTNDVAIKKIWEYGIKQKLPTSVEVNQYQHSASKIKIFRKSQFKKFHKLK